MFLFIILKIHAQKICKNVFNEVWGLISPSLAYQLKVLKRFFLFQKELVITFL